MSHSERIRKALSEQERRDTERYWKAAGGLPDLDLMRRAEKLAIYVSLMVGIAVACAVIVHWFPLAPVGYGLAAGFGLVAGGIAFKFLTSGIVQEILELVVVAPKTALAIVAAVAVTVLVIRAYTS